MTNPQPPAEYFEKLLQGTTAGPWNEQIDEAPFYIAPSNGFDPCICDLLPRDADSFTSEDEANARLIAAAPDLARSAAELARENAELRALCACAYQAAGAHDFDVKWLDAFSAAANGMPFSSENLLPMDTPDHLQRAESAERKRDAAMEKVRVLEASMTNALAATTDKGEKG